MKIVRLLPCLAAIAAAEMIPRLRAPVSAPVPLQAQTLSAFGDSAFVARYGYMGLFARTRDEVSLVADTAAHQVTSEIPHVFRTGPGMDDLVMGYDRILRLDRRVVPWTFSVADSGHGVGYGWASGGMFRVGGQSPQNLLICGLSNSYQLGADLRPGVAAAPWRSVDTLGPYTGTSYCDVDSATSWGAILTPAGSGAWKVRAGRMDGLMGTDPTALGAATPTWIAAAADQRWIAYDGQRHTLYGGTTGAGGTVDSTTLDLPAAASPAQSFSHRDSLVAFGAGSLLVVAKWTGTTFRVVSRTELSSTRHVLATAIGDSTLWALTGDTLYSFRWGWSQESSTGIGAATVVPARLSVAGSGREVRLSWNGTGAATARIRDLRGATAATIRLEPGVPAAWAAPRPGTWLVQVAGESRSFATP